jgi:hypothetical protein
MFRVFLAVYLVDFIRLQKKMNTLKKNWGTIPAGTKGWVVKKWGKKYFSADENQPEIKLFTPTDQPYVLIPYSKIKDAYKKI